MLGDFVSDVDNPRTFDVVRVNSTYSLRWDSKNYEDDFRFKFGVTPASKADCAFLLHGLLHSN
ncbi:N-6 DNA methylase [Weissella cibaria]|uniref:N-6 DNA methylase n=1 Tax=Weissella cibaria TaxID=137591 RepID=UPI001190FD7C|nr:N-6 DNA methylase [Weissella cibaria]